VKTAKKSDRNAGGATVDPAELEKFGRMAESWWDPRGKFRPLHKVNPTRIAFIRDTLTARLRRDRLTQRPLEGLRLLDIGCGGGLLSEPMARLGAQVTGIDPTARNISVAQLHAKQSGLSIDYRVATAEELAAAGERFDVVLNMEVVEHVADLTTFIAECCDLTGEQGVMFVATINRTPKSFLFAIIGAEYVLRWLPRGTHDWNKFVRPSELATAVRRARAEISSLTGVSYDPLRDSWNLSRDLDVNYMATVSRAGDG
jgi:2-polyprenyl-6-hydroxyphenyl methylase / 3-demethylubiquinone-9 3-methyltransferase